MDTSTYLQLGVGLVGDLKSVADTDQIQGHAGNLPSMIDTIFLRDPRDHHVWWSAIVPQVGKIKEEREIHG